MKRRRHTIEQQEPTSAEIAERAAAIRAEWTSREMARRAGMQPDAELTVTVATLHLSPEVRP